MSSEALEAFGRLHRHKELVVAITALRVRRDQIQQSFAGRSSNCETPFFSVAMAALESGSVVG